MKQSDLYLKLLRGGIFVSLLVPLVIFSQFISPFHFGKAVVFRSLVEIMAVIYILLIISNKKYLPKWRPIVISFTIFTGLFALTSFTAVDFNYAFWGTLERMGGLFSFLHFWVWFIILISIIRERKDWERLLKLSIFVGFLSILFAYGQYLINIDVLKGFNKFFIGWQHGNRVIGTIGNPALFTGYLLFILFLSIYYLFRPASPQGGKDIKVKEKFFYGAVLILGTSIILHDEIRGSIIALFVGLFLLGIFYCFFIKNKKAKRLIVVGLIIFIILAGFLWLNRDKDWVKEISWVNRITSISLENSTAQTRLWSWQSGFEGFKERPILGWGTENFVLAHAKYFDPRHFKSIGSETIWDRAHNIVLEMLTTMGVVGLLSYLSIFAVVYWMLIKRFKQKKIGTAELGVLGTMLVVYFIHNLFIFDTTANYYMFFLVLGYINFITKPASASTPTDAEASAGKEKKPSIFLILILLFLAVILIYKTNIEPAKANYICTRAILAGRGGDNQKAFNKYREALSFKSPQGKYEIRHKLAKFIIQYNSGLKRKENRISEETLNYTIEEVKKNIETHPLDYIPYLYVGRMYIMMINEREGVGEKAEEYINGALAINDKNPRVWYELGQAQLSQKKDQAAIKSFERALELNPNVRESNWFLGMTYVQADEEEKAVKYIDKAIEMGYNYKDSINDIMRLIDLYSKVKDYYKVIDLYKEAIAEQPDNPQFYASIAATYRAVGDIENAIFYAQRAAEINSDFKEETEAFINSLQPSEQQATNSEE